MPFRSHHAFKARLRAAALTATTATAVVCGLPALPAAAAVAPSDQCRCAALQRDVDAYRRGEVQYFVDPTPAWTREAARYGCGIPGLDAPLPTRSLHRAAAAAVVIR